ncbi:MAG TPA: TIGR03088 family PEP-CTERM/XrtA system glycosyltransferase [Rhodanobacteraceae bacterium]|nr:TIGR03088 family PEP-CTERM/XrtA system glycosyltransferase [Rhodanobacteraceae bacterium]
MSARPLIAHVLYRLDTGGMEQVLVSVINRTSQRYRHAIICLAGFGAMRTRIADASVPCVSLAKRPGKDPGCYWRFWKLLRDLRPDLVQTYNLGALDLAPVARLAGVRRVVHAEHGWDVADPRGESRKYRALRRWLAPCIARYVAVSADLERWLREVVGIAPARLAFIPNGIDTARYVAATPTSGGRPLLGTFAPPGTLLIGTVGRLDAVKDQARLIDALHLLCARDADAGHRLRLVVVGEGRERAHLERHIQDLGLQDRVRLLGNRDDVPALLAEFDVFALCSIAEGIPLTVLEAMAAGLPVVATRVGGVPEVVIEGETGTLVPASDAAALARALDGYVRDPGLRRRHGAAGQARVRARFSLTAMVAAYTGLYDQLLAGRQRPARRTAALAKRGEP